MSVKLVPEEDVRAALRPYRPDANAFEVGIRARIKADVESHENEDSEMQSPLLRVAAAFLPWPLITGGKIVGGGSKFSSMAIGQKLLAYAALPAISLFCLIGAAFFSVVKIRSLQKGNHPDIGDENEMRKAVRQWWGRHKWVALVVFAAVLILPMIGSTWLLFLLLLVSFGSLLGFLSGFARLGVGNRLMIGQSCMMGLIFLGQAMVNPLVGQRDIHFIDQKLIAAVLFAGTLILLPFVICSMKHLGIFRPITKREDKTSSSILLICSVFCSFAVADCLLFILLRPLSGNGQSPVFGGYGWVFFAAVIFVQVATLIAVTVGRFRKTGVPRFAAGLKWIWGLLYACLMVPILMWFANPILWPASPARLQHHVESFEIGRYPFISWHDWEITASWAIEAGLDPDLSRARGLLDDEISGEQHPFILSSAFRVGLVRPDQIEQLIGFEDKHRSLIPEHSSRQPYQITSLNQKVWVIHALDQSGQLSPEDRDFLEQRLLATLDDPVSETADVLETALRVTQLLDVIDRPIDRDKYRWQMHEWLREFHGKETHYFQIAGGFEQYKDLSSSLQVTSHAIQLMQIYGVPDDLDLNWVRSYLRPLHFRPSIDDKWIAAVTLDRLNRLPGVTQPTLLELLYYERSLITAMVLVALCIYATVSSPNPVIDASSNHDDVGKDVS